ncbi:uncharacterized protein LOC126565631 [Anopheles maculipalpis]|uniref:uncharacterized protein LOC126565631 n=1 Tax=Anopheles maculipalpis TaxID=1496333 RepID=UPI0021593474|nr:uncharacterized protein LOC126565631 [Anopheles maculipalpis]
MVGSICESGKYFPVGLIGILLIGATLGSPLPQQDEISNEIDQVATLITTTSSSSSGSSTSSTTTEFPYEAVAKIYSSPPDKVGTLQYSSGVHKFRIGPNENEQKRLLEEYYYHFERVEKNLPPTTRKYNFEPPKKY